MPENIDIETAKALLLKPEVMQYFVQHIKELPQQTQAFFSSVIAGGQKSTDAIKAVGTAAESMTKDISNSNPIIQGLISKFELLNGVSFDHVVQGIFGLNKGLTESTIKAGEFYLALSGKIPIADTLQAAGDQAKITTAGLVETADVLGKHFETIAGKTGKEFAEVIHNISAVAEPAKRFEESMTAMQISSGNLSKFLQEVGSNFEGLPRYAQKFSDVTTSVGNATGMTSAEVAKYAMQLGKIPGALEQTIKSYESGAAGTTILQGAIAVATAAGVSHSDVIEEMSKKYRAFNTSGEDVLKQFSRMAQVSRDVNMPMDLVKGAVERTSQEFKYLGDNTLASINILERFGSSLEGKLGVGAISELASNVISSMNRLDTAQSAFLSKSSGGPGGLRGAVQIEQLKAEGRTDELFDMVKQSLNKQFGGKIVTREDAAQDERAAGQYYKQVQLLTQGPTKMASSSAEAAALLQMMKEDKGYDKSKTGDKALKETMELGQDIQKRHLDQLLLIRNSVSAIANSAAIRQYDNVRAMTGSEGPAKSMFISSMMKEESLAAGDKAKNFGRDPHAIISQTVEDPTAILHGRFKDGIGAIMSDAKGSLSKMIEEVGFTRFIPKAFLNESPQVSSQREMPQSKQQVVQTMQKVEDKEGKSIPHVHTPVPATHSGQGGRVDVVSHHICSSCKKTIDSQLIASVVGGAIQESENAKRMAQMLGRETQ